MYVYILILLTFNSKPWEDDFFKSFVAVYTDIFYLVLKLQNNIITRFKMVVMKLNIYIILLKLSK